MSRPGWQIAKTPRHVSKGIVGMEKTAGSRIDESDAAGHVRQHIFVEDDFALNPLFGFQSGVGNIRCPAMRRPQ